MLAHERSVLFVPVGLKVLARQMRQAREAERKLDHAMSLGDGRALLQQHLVECVHDLEDARVRLVLAEG